ncbi:hypothetical protein E2320_019680 [Naja naja]|nr:hypothetical protein E2320_019680 [Naja naja]
MQEKVPAEKDLAIRALEEENNYLASEMVHLMRENKELQNKKKDNPERGLKRKQGEKRTVNSKTPVLLFGTPSAYGLIQPGTTRTGWIALAKQYSQVASPFTPLHLMTTVAIGPNLIPLEVVT